MLELAAKCNISGMTADHIDHQLRDDEGNDALDTAEQLALKFTMHPFDYKVEEENFYYLKTVLAKKNGEFGSIKRVVSFVKNKISQFDTMAKTQVEELLQELREIYIPRSDLFKEIMGAQTDSPDKWNFHDTILGFSLIDKRIQKRHKFAFIYQLFKEDPTMSQQTTQLNILSSAGHAQISKKTN